MMDYVNNKFRAQAIGYISGFVVKMLQKIVKCSECMTVCYGELDGSLKMYRTLLTLKNKGGLIIPSADVIKICVITDSIICYLNKIKNDEIFNKSLDLKISQLLLKKFKMDEMFTQLNDHDFDHKISLIRATAICYTKIKKFHIIKLLNQKKTDSSIRKRLSRIIINKCQ